MRPTLLLIIISSSTRALNPTPRPTRHARLCNSTHSNSNTIPPLLSIPSCIFPLHITHSTTPGLHTTPTITTPPSTTPLSSTLRISTSTRRFRLPPLAVYHQMLSAFRATQDIIHLLAGLLASGGTIGIGSPTKRPFACTSGAIVDTIQARAQALIARNLAADKHICSLALTPRHLDSPGLSSQPSSSIAHHLDVEKCAKHMRGGPGARRARLSVDTVQLVVKTLKV